MQPVCKKEFRDVVSSATCVLPEDLLATCSYGSSCPWQSQCPPPLLFRSFTAEVDALFSRDANSSLFFLASRLGE